MASTSISTVTVPALAINGGAPLDLVSLADVKLELELSDNSQDAWLRKAIRRSSASIAKYCNRIDRTFQVQSYHDEIWPFRDAYPYQLPGRLAPLQLQAWPITSVPSLAGIAAPAAPVLAASNGAALAAANYAVRISYVTATGETAASPEARISLPAAALLTVASPPADPTKKATGWNIYVGTPGAGWTAQSGAPLPLGTSWTEPATGLVPGAPVPNHMLVVLNLPSETRILTEGVDFKVDAVLGHVIRLNLDGTVARWDAASIAVDYPAGFAAIPDDVQEGAILLVKGRSFGRKRDPLLRSQNSPGVYEAAYFFGQGPGTTGDLPPEVAAKVERYRMPVIA